MLRLMATNRRWTWLLAFFAAALTVLLASLPAGQAYSAPQKPFLLPFKDQPGPTTWLMGQAYGNTAFAYPQRDELYGLSQGIHFGVDLTAPCGTEILAIGDGVVYAVDNLNFGSAPHNLIIDHPEHGFASLYGHLLNAPDLTVGQKVRQGEVVAHVGDPVGEGCYADPHLHLEIRDTETHRRKFNPVLYISADWDKLAMVERAAATFQYDLEEPRKWQYLDDQPEAVSGGTMLNDFDATWPLDWKVP